MKIKETNINTKKKCELCEKKTYHVFADCYANLFLCDDCYSDYDYYKDENAEDKIDKAIFKKILSKIIIN